jgi:Kef-type K+ transport system membrane component KefB
MISPFFDVAVIIIVATVLAYLARALRQPMLVAYVLAGVILGPAFLGLVTDTAEINMFLELGIAFLLFTVGLEIDIQKLRTVGLAATTGAIIQIVVTFFAGTLIAGLLGFGVPASIYVGLLLAFSSTMIVTKILVDGNEINTLHGRIMLGVLLIQDIAVIAILPIISDFSSILSYEFLVSLMIKGLGLFSLAVVLNRYVLRRIMDYAAKSYEILFLTAVSVCFLFIGVAHAMDFSIVIGAFIGGIAIASFPYNMEISGEIHSLRDFFAVVFFAGLGMQIGMGLGVLQTMLLEFFVLLIAILTIKPVVLSLIYLFIGYGGRTANTIGLGLGQASEFSLIIATLALNASGAMKTPVDFYYLIISVVVTSMVLTPYLMKYRNAFYRLFSRLGSSDRFRHRTHAKRVHGLEKKHDGMRNHMVLFGADRMGSKLVDFLFNKKQNFYVVDHNPDIIRKLSERGVYCVYGDGSNEDVLKKVGVYHARLVILTIPNMESSCFVTSRVRRLNPHAKIFARANSALDAENLYKCGANFVLVPEFVSSEIILRKVARFVRKKR